MADADNERTLATPISQPKPADVPTIKIVEVVVRLDVGGRGVELAFPSDGRPGASLMTTGAYGTVTARKALDVIKAVRDALVTAGALP